MVCVRAEVVSVCVCVGDVRGMHGRMCMCVRKEGEGGARRGGAGVCVVYGWWVVLVVSNWLLVIGGVNWKLVLALGVIDS